MAACLEMPSTVDPRLLAARRRRLGLTQAALAARIGASVNELSRLERALMPGELLDRVIAALAAVTDETPQT